MSDTEKADYRAQGALQNFILDMQGKLSRENRSPEYQAQFWQSLRHEMGAMLGKAN